VPAPEFFRGLYLAHQSSSASIQPRRGYLLGDIYIGGRWDFFPVGILTKTPIATLLLSALGLGVCLCRAAFWRSRPIVTLLAGIVGPMTVAMLGEVNIGLRHVLCIFPFVAILGAIGALHLWRLASHPRLARTAAVLLLLWPFETCLAASPQFLPYFNELAAPRAGRILIDSDLDWGQDLYALERRLQNVPPADVSLDYFGDQTILRHASAHWHTLQFGERRTGWLAISETDYQLHRADYAWLTPFPVTWIGRSIRLYHVVP
jgi:hypothetical protein